MAKKQFWLKIRKEYVMDNFENLLNYLQEYDYVVEPLKRKENQYYRQNLFNQEQLSPQGVNEINSGLPSGATHEPNQVQTVPYRSYYEREAEADNLDFEESLRCMEEVADDIFATVVDTPVYDKLELPYDLPTVLRLFTAILLANKKRNVTDYRTIARIAAILTREKRGARYPEMERIIISCIRHDVINGYSLGWTDIDPDLDFMMGVYEEKFSKISFHKRQEVTPVIPYLEKSGLLLLPPDTTPVLSPLNLDKYRQDSKNLAVQLSVAGMMDFKVRKVDYEKSRDFNALYSVCNSVLASQSTFIPAVRRSLKRYATDDCILVRIIEKHGMSMKAETVDPDYEKIVGKVNIRIQNQPSRPTGHVLGSLIKKGDFLKVSLSSVDGFAFITDREFERFYRDYAADGHDMVFRAMFSSRYPKGDIWLTDDGVRVAVDNKFKENMPESELEDYEYAMHNGIPINLKFYSNRPPTNREEFYVYASVGGEGEIITDGHFFPEDAYRKIFGEYLEESREHGETLAARAANAGYTPIEDAQGLLPLYFLYCAMVEAEVGNTLERLQILTITQFMGRMLGRNMDVAYLDVQRKYLAKIVGFAADEDMTSLNIPAELAHNERCESEQNIVRTLQGYKKKNLLVSNVYSRNRKVDVSVAVEKLVEASNSLIDIIDTLELNNIKQSIAKALGVQDEYKSIIDSRTFYGMESINLEFKTSVVYPPVKAGGMVQGYPQPDVQKWNIIKSVCGFLNSRSGGDLLIGVNDAGYAVTLDDDLRELTRLRIISAPNLDQYRNYIQTMLDLAYCSVRDGKTLDHDISRRNIRVEIETNEEKTPIIRVKVTPSRSIVYLTALDRPADFRASYLRENGRTIELTDALLPVVASYKPGF